SGLEVGGWINGGITYNANNPSDGFNGTVTFADRANEFQLNQFARCDNSLLTSSHVMPLLSHRTTIIQTHP
ncbi:MAG: outer membrane beta-barrel protein, partial [Betaproteobacteria bacterium]|nr:outer membrane beta-barrel protein [Betaproteobacteria bacterium]